MFCMYKFFYGPLEARVSWKPTNNRFAKQVTKYKDIYFSNGPYCNFFPQQMSKIH